MAQLHYTVEVKGKCLYRSEGLCFNKVAGAKKYIEDFCKGLCGHRWAWEKSNRNKTQIYRSVDSSDIVYTFNIQ